MKKILAVLAAVSAGISTLGQGTVNFQNFVPNVVNAPIWAPGGTGTTGWGILPGATAQLYQVTGTGASAVYTPIGQSSTFRPPTAGNPILNAYIVGDNVMEIDGVAPGSTITVVLRAWADASSYDEAMLKGQSPNSVTITLGGQIDPTQPATTPPTLAGLQGFELVPEPSTIAFGLIGAAALLYRRRS